MVRSIRRLHKCTSDSAMHAKQHQMLRSMHNHDCCNARWISEYNNGHGYPLLFGQTLLHASVNTRLEFVSARGRLLWRNDWRLARVCWSLFLGSAETFYCKQSFRTSVGFLIRRANIPDTGSIVWNAFTYWHGVWKTSCTSRIWHCFDLTPPDIDCVTLCRINTTMQNRRSTQIAGSLHIIVTTSARNLISSRICISPPGFGLKLLKTSRHIRLVQIPRGEQKPVKCFRSVTILTMLQSIIEKCKLFNRRLAQSWANKRHWPGDFLTINCVQRHLYCLSRCSWSFAQVPKVSIADSPSPGGGTGVTSRQQTGDCGQRKNERRRQNNMHSLLSNARTT